MTDFDSDELKIPQGFQKCIVLWVSEQYLKSYLLTFEIIAT